METKKQKEKRKKQNARKNKRQVLHSINCIFERRIK